MRRIPVTVSPLLSPRTIAYAIRIKRSTP
jgi:hypothetical protein